MRYNKNKSMNILSDIATTSLITKQDPKTLVYVQ